MIEKEKIIEIIDPVVVIIGPTAVGKTDLSINISNLFDCEVVSIDSMQVYRSMDIGTAKVTMDERCGIEHHLIDIVNPDEAYNASQFVNDALIAINRIHSRGHIPLLTGGTGLYLHSLKNGLFQNVPSDKKIRELLNARIKEEGSEPLYEELQVSDLETSLKIHKNDTSRIIRALEVFSSTGIPLSEHIKKQKNSGSPHKFKNIFTIGLSCDRNILYDRINRRTAIMIDQGLESEVCSLLERGYNSSLKSMQSIGYRHMVNYLNNIWSKDKMIEYLARDTRRYAKRQFTWFRKDSSINWIDRTKDSKIVSSIGKWLSAKKNN